MELDNSIISDYNVLEREYKENNDFYFNSYNVFEDTKKVKDTIETLNKIFNSNDNSLTPKFNIKDKEEDEIFLNKKKAEKKFTIYNKGIIEERFDYKLKKFKVKIGNHLIKNLKIYAKPLHIKFYKFNSIKFNSNVNYSNNKEWLNYKIKTLLIKFDNNEKKNFKNLEKLKKKKDTKEKTNLLNLLNLTYEQYIIQNNLNESNFLEIIKNTPGYKKNNKQ
jgi:hypothetical protein